MIGIKCTRITLLTEQWDMNVVLLKNGPTPASFLFIFCLFIQTMQFLQQIYVRKYPSSIQCWDSNPRLSERESLPITTRPGLPPSVVWWLNVFKYSTSYSFAIENTHWHEADDWQVWNGFRSKHFIANKHSHLV